MRHIYILGAAFAISSFLFTPALLMAQSQTCTALAPFDPDKDGTIDLAEAKTSASALFDKLNKDSDSTLDAKELKGHLSAKEIRAADPDKDGTLDKAEYLAVVEARFKTANPDNDGTIDCKEAGTKAGKVFLKLLQ